MIQTSSDVSHNTSEVLMIEDSEDEVSVALRAIRRRGLERRVRVINNGAEAIEFLQRLREQPGAHPLPRAIFLDLRMPGIGGKRVLREIRGHDLTRQIPVIIVSSTRRRSEIDECYQLGANSFISKRYGDRNPGEYLAEAVHYWLNLNTVTR